MSIQNFVKMALPVLIWEASAQNLCDILCIVRLLCKLCNIKPRIHKHAEQFANRSQMVRKPNVCMCGRDCEPTLRHPRTVRVLFAENQNSSVFRLNTKRTRCTVYPFHASGVLRSPQVRGKLINRAPLTHCIGVVQRVSGALVLVFCANTRRTGCTGCPFHAPGVLCSAQVHGKLINRKQRARVYKALDSCGLSYSCQNKVCLCYLLYLAINNSECLRRSTLVLSILHKTRKCKIVTVDEMFLFGYFFVIRRI